jgi:anti-sigma factor RsiW
MNDDGHRAQARLELGVYLLGAIEPAQRALVGRHLAACPQCRAELAGLAGLPSLLRKVPAGEALQLPPDAAALVPGPSLAGRVSGIRRRRWCLTAAAAVIAGFAAASGLQALYAGAAPPASRDGAPVGPHGQGREPGDWGLGGRPVHTPAVEHRGGGTSHRRLAVALAGSDTAEGIAGDRDPEVRAA